MGSEASDRDTVVTQISVGGLEDFVTAKILSDYLEDQIGMVWRCRLKTSSTPLESYPNFEADPELVKGDNNYMKVEPHAYVHFALPRAAKEAFEAADCGKLVLGGKPLKVSLGLENPRRVNERRRTTTPYKMSDIFLEIGAMRSRDEFVVGWRSPPNGVDFLVDPFNGTCKILLTKDVVFSFKGEACPPAVIKCNIKLEFLPREINIIRSGRDFSSLIISLQLASSPFVYYRTADDDIEESVPFDLLDDDDPWIRTTDFTPSGAIGRCNAYRITMKPRNGPSLNRALDYLRRRRVPILDVGARQPIKVFDERDFGFPMSDPFYCAQYVKNVTFKVVFLLNAVIHRGVINQHQLSDSLLDLLRSQSEELNLVALKHMCSYKRPVYDAPKALHSVQKWLLNNPKLLERREMADIVEVRRLIITPSRAYCLPPEVELSNRVLRHYRHLADRFLRVTFMDEAMQTLNKGALTYYLGPIVRNITSNYGPQKTVMFKRVKDILTSGFYLCGRRYTFLAFSANQLRDRSAWFFAEDRTTTTAQIRKWMGRFTDRNVAKCAARMGQCFSSTYATVEVPSQEVDANLPDVRRNDYVFSDGIGIISPDLANQVAEKLQLSRSPPCAYQIRYAGFKGVVACWPPNRGAGIRLCLRPSMKKFDSQHTMLEICSWTRFQPGFLNRQIITLLSALEVDDDIFWKMQENMVSRLDGMLTDSDTAYDVLITSCGDLGITAAIMLSAGFTPQTEQHLFGMLRSIRAAQIGDLRERARIFVPSGRWLMGCFDESGVLEQGECFVQVSSPSVAECFVSHGGQFSETKKDLRVIEGLVAIAKNPCLHPGDVRILKAIDRPDLHHLYDCLVFPQKGDRPHTNEASGSDLDGDLYFVTWDENLIPPSKKSWTPMEYAPGEVKQNPREINQRDIINFFTQNMVNESLGSICNAHVVHADISKQGALDEKCIKLAELAATAVDFPKTGKVVVMPPDLKPKMYPDFMGKEEFQTYASTKILGRLYRRVRDATVTDSTPPENTIITYDKELEVEGFEDFISEAWSCKCNYDAQLSGLLDQYKVYREEELVTGHIWSMPKYSSKKQGELKERLRHAYNSLRKEFRKVFESLGEIYGGISDEEKNTVYERKASAWYQVTYHEKWLNEGKELRALHDEDYAQKSSVMLSFAWIAADYLARVKIRHGMSEENSISDKPIDSLRRFLAHRI